MVLFAVIDIVGTIPIVVDLKNKLDEWRPDTFNAGDAARVIQSFPNYFTLTEERWRGPR